MTGICLPKGFINDTRVQKIVMEKFDGLLLRNLDDYNFYLAHKGKLSKSLIDGADKDWQGVNAYIDEPSHKWAWSHDKLDALVNDYPNIIIGDLNKSSLKEYAEKYTNVTLTYTAYCGMWFNFYDCGWDFRIPAWFGLIKTNQLKTWEWMHKEFGNRFGICWINFSQMNDKKLFEWAKLNGKEIFIYVEDYLTVEQFLTKILN